MPFRGGAATTPQTQNPVAMRARCRRSSQITAEWSMTERCGLGRLAISHPQRIRSEADRVARRQRAYVRRRHAGEAQREVDARRRFQRRGSALPGRQDARMDGVNGRRTHRIVAAKTERASEVTSAPSDDVAVWGKPSPTLHGWLAVPNSAETGSRTTFVQKHACKHHHSRAYCAYSG